MNMRTAMAASLLLALTPTYAKKYVDYSPAYQEGYAKIAFLEGDWRAKNFQPRRGEGGKIEWVPYEDTTRRFTRVFDGAALIDAEGPETAARKDPPMRFQGIYSYDQFKDAYRVIYTDDNTGLLDVYEGSFVDGHLVVSNQSGGTYWKNGDQRFFGRVIFTFLPPDRFDVVFESSRDEGKSWLPASRTEHYRINAEDQATRSEPSSIDSH